MTRSPCRFALPLLFLLSGSCMEAPGLWSLATALNREYPDTHAGVSGFDSLRTVSIAFGPSRHGEAAPGRNRLPFRFARADIRAGLGPADSSRAVATCQEWTELQ